MDRPVRLWTSCRGGGFTAAGDLGGLARGAFTGSTILGAAIWTGGYKALGDVFAGQLDRVPDMLSDVFGLITAGAVLFGSGNWFMRQWRAGAMTTT